MRPLQLREEKEEEVGGRVGVGEGVVLLRSTCIVGYIGGAANAIIQYMLWLCVCALLPLYAVRFHVHAGCSNFRSILVVPFIGCICAAPHHRFSIPIVYRLPVTSRYVICLSYRPCCEPRCARGRDRGRGRMFSFQQRGPLDIQLRLLYLSRLRLVLVLFELERGLSAVAAAGPRNSSKSSVAVNFLRL